MDKAAIGKQDHMPLWQPDGAHLLKHGLIVLKSDLGTSVAHGEPGQRDGTTSVDERGTDQDKGSQSRGIQGNIHMGVSRPIAQGYS